MMIHTDHYVTAAGLVDRLDDLWLEGWHIVAVIPATWHPGNDPANPMRRIITRRCDGCSSGVHKAIQARQRLQPNVVEEMCRKCG